MNTREDMNRRDNDFHLIYDPIFRVSSSYHFSTCVGVFSCRRRQRRNTSEVGQLKKIHNENIINLVITGEEILKSMLI